MAKVKKVKENAVKQPIIQKEIPKVEEDDTLFRGQINYRILEGKDKNLKSYYFGQKTAEEVKVLERRYRNPLLYEFCGIRKDIDERKSKILAEA